MRAALRELGAPIAHSRLTNLLARVLPPPAAPRPEEVAVGSVEQRLAVQDIVLAVWAELDDDSRGLLTGLARGDDYDALVARHPGLRSRSGVSRAARRLADLLLARLSEAFPGALGDRAGAPGSPRSVLEDVLDVLLPLVGAEALGVARAGAEEVP